MTIGFIGLGKMGSRMVAKLATEGHEVHVWNRTAEVAGKLLQEVPILQVASSVKALVQGLTPIRIIWMMLPAGDPTEQVLVEITSYLSSGDIVIDGGNANFRDTERRFSEFSKKHIRFLGIGVSGGVIAYTSGYPLMVGGDKSAYEEIKPLLDSLAKPNGGHSYFGLGGAGHFVKMVHNGIEYGVMQALGEGFEVLFNSPYNLHLLEVAKLWQKGTLVSGFMLDRTVEALLPDPTLSHVTGSIAASGEAEWMVKEAKVEGVSVDVIAQSVAYRTRSQSDPSIQSSFTAKLIAALRNAFGGHELILTP